MRKELSCLLAACAVALGARAQVTAEITQSQDQFLSGEAVPLAVRITNRSGRSLRLGDQPDWLTFAVDSKEGGTEIVPKFSEVPVEGGFDLPPSKTAVKRVDIQPHFGLSEPARYAVTATVKIPGWERDINSPAKSFYVIEGTRMWEQAVGIPNSATNGEPQVRKYILQQANYIKGQLKLYLRVLDGHERVLKVDPIGGVLSFSRPEPQVDKDSNLHLIYQSGPSSFTYLLFDTEGTTLKRETYDYINNRPRLKVDEDGKITVTGGVRRVTKDDVPPPVPEGLADLDQSDTNAPAGSNAQPVSTNLPPPIKPAG